MNHRGRLVMTSMSRADQGWHRAATTAIGVVLAITVGGCASGGPCRTGTRGWFSGWGAGGGSAFTVGLRGAWDDCETRPGTPARPPSIAPAPSPDPASE